MDQLEGGSGAANVNVTLAQGRSECRWFEGRQYPCPTCGVGLEILLSVKEKPYCVCNLCKLQVFWRGKEGIRRLREILHSETVITANGSSPDLAVILFNRIQQLRDQKKQLEAKKGLILVDPDLKSAISVVDIEILRVQRELAKLARKAKPEKSK
jgi:hypothetical protein